MKLTSPWGRLYSEPLSIPQTAGTINNNQPLVRYPRTQSVTHLTHRPVGRCGAWQLDPSPTLIKPVSSLPGTSKGCSLFGVLRFCIVPWCVLCSAPSSGASKRPGSKSTPQNPTPSDLNHSPPVPSKQYFIIITAPWAHLLSNSPPVFNEPS